MPPRLPFSYRSYANQIPRDQFEAPPMGSAGRMGHRYETMLKTQFDAVFRHAIAMWGLRYVGERAAAMLNETQRQEGK